MKRLIAYFFAMLGIALTGMANDTYTGRVVDYDGNPISGARIQIIGTTEETTTDEDGLYSITPTYIGSYMSIRAVAR